MIKILVIGKKHDKLFKCAIIEFEKRLKKPFDVHWQILSHSSFEENRAREDESQKILKTISNDECIILLDERGKNISSPEFSSLINEKFINSKNVIIIIGGAFGVNNELRQRADFVWSLSNLVFPHQIVRLILIEQIYRAQEISQGGKYHHL